MPATGLKVPPRGYQSLSRSAEAPDVMVSQSVHWTAAQQASLSLTNPRSLLKLIFIESVMPSNHLILCQPLLLLPSILSSIKVSGQSIGVSASTSVLPMKMQGLFLLGLTGLILAVQGTLKSLLQHHNSKYIIYVHISGNIFKYTHISVYYYTYTSS